MHILLHKDDKISIGGRYVIAVFLAVMGAVAIVAAKHESKKANTARTWEGKKAVVIHSEISTHQRYRNGSLEVIPKSGTTYVTY
jgi:hypothetical protein